MKKIIHKAIKHPLISGSAIFLTGSMLTNILGYLYNIAMGRLLSHQDFGVLAALMAILGIFSVFPSTISLTFTKFSASYVGQGKKELIGALLKKGTLWVCVLAIPIFIVLLLFSSVIGNFLHINNFVVMSLIFLTLCISFLSAVPSGILQGMMLFVPSSITTIVIALIKIISGIFLVMMGFHIFGAAIAIVTSSIFGYVFIFFPFRKYLVDKQSINSGIQNFRREIVSYSFPIFLATLGFTFFSSIDVILVKHFFTPVEAGNYAALSIMGKSIFYAIGPIVAVFFPLIIQKKERSESILKTVLLATFLVGIPALGLSILYFTIPNIIMNIFFPTYKGLAPYLGPFSIFIFLFTLISLFNSLCLSLHKTKVFIVTIGGSLLEAMLIILFHGNIHQIITDLIIASTLLLLCLLIYYPVVTHQYGKR